MFQLHNTDHTHTVIQRILDKYDIKGKEKDYCLLQALPDGGKICPLSSKLMPFDIKEHSSIEKRASCFRD